MRIAILILLFVASLSGADSDSDSKLLLRFTGGMGVSSDMLGLEARMLAGSSRMPVLIGVQGMGLADFTLFVTPSESNSSVHLIVARELYRGNVGSVLVYGGGGRAKIVERGKLIDQHWLGEEYEAITTESPSALVGIDCGVSYHHVIGVSFQVGALLNAKPTGFVMVQADLGRW